MKLTVAEIVNYSGGSIVAGDPETKIHGFSIDSRSIKKGDFFIPLPGSQTDGHQFINSALEKGAAGSFFVPGKWDCYIMHSDKTLIKVYDSLKALQNVAYFYRNKFNIPVIGITGSSGKTTTKDLIASILDLAIPVLKTEGNLNNHIGLPLTLLRLNEYYHAAVLEMGMSSIGEIKLLSNLARPQVGVITNIGEAHLESLSSVERIAEAKSELLENLNPNGIAILNGDDLLVRRISKKYKGKKLFYGLHSENELYARIIEQHETGTRFKAVSSDQGSFDFYIPLLGLNNVCNALAAIAVGYYFKISKDKIYEGLLNPRLTGMRMELITITGGTKIINDTYNANPQSMQAALQILRDLPTQALKIAILGDMLELGDYAEKAHRKIGAFAVMAGIDYLITYGNLSSNIAKEAIKLGIPEERVFHLADIESIIDLIKKLKDNHNIGYILVKGSRGIKMENITKALLEIFTGGGSNEYSII